LICFQRAESFWQTSGDQRREIAKSYSVVITHECA